MSAHISVIIPVYNRKRRVKDAIESVLLQKECDFELIVVDDGSEEDLSEAKALVESSGHRFLSIEHSGVAAARNFGVKNSSGKYLAFLDSDDVWLPKKLSSQVDYFRDNPQMRLCQCNEIWFRNGVRVNPKKFHAMPDGEAFEVSVARCVISASSIMLEREVFEEIGYFDESMRVCEDYDYWIRVTAKYPIGLIPKGLVEKFGGHEDQLSRSEPAMDRFRVYSLLNLVLSGSLSEGQCVVALRELERKSSILADGAVKREQDNAWLFDELEAQTSRVLKSGSILQELSRLEPYQVELKTEILS